MSSKNKKDVKGGFPLKRIMIISLIGCFLFFIFTALFSCLILKNGISSSLYMPVGMVLGAVSAVLSGFATVRPIKEKGALYGALTGFIQSLLCSVVLFVVNGGSAGTGIFILAGLMILASALGGIAAVNLKVKKKY